MEAPRRDGAPTRTLTAVIAERVKTLRGQARLSGPALAAAMNDHGIPWNRTTVAKLETGRRETVTVQELLVLAIVLNVPPVWLLADPKAGAAVPVSEGIEVDPWTALLWMVGYQPLTGTAGSEWNDAKIMLVALQQLARLIEAYEQQRNLQNDDLVEPAQDGGLILGIQSTLAAFELRHWPVPPVPARVRKRADELGYGLAGQDELAP